jgi:hypothetical protein
VRNAALHWAAAQWREATWWMALKGSVGQGANQWRHGTGEESLNVGMEHHLGVRRGKQLPKLRRMKVLSSTAMEWSEETWWKVGWEEGPPGKDSVHDEGRGASGMGTRMPTHWRCGERRRRGYEDSGGEKSALGSCR